MRLLALAAFALGTSLAAQTETNSGTGALLRALDKVSGAVNDFELPSGGEAQIGRVTVSLSDCRYPAGNPQGDAFAWLTVEEEGREVFSGWMVASSPALNAMDHPRYDVWVLRCNSS